MLIIFILSEFSQCILSFIVGIEIMGLIDYFILGNRDIFDKE
jgi:hypothetical protein